LKLSGGSNRRYDRLVPSKLKWTLAIAAVAGLLAAPAFAQATLVFVRNPLKQAIYTAANDGSGQKRLASGSIPRISPDGTTVAYYHANGGPSYRPDLMVVPATGSAAPRRLIAGWRETYVFAWSPDSKTIAAVRGPELGRQKLVLIDVASGAQRTIASGYFSGVSFAPEGGQLVYARAAKEKYPPRSDIYRVATTGGSPARLTSDHRSLDPVWGPGGSIVFVKLLGAKSRRYGPKNELYLMNSEGGQVRRLTHTKVGSLLQGLAPTQWSADGKRLLTEFGGQDTSYAVTVNPQTGAERTLTKERERGLVGAALSADGATVLGATGGAEPGPGHDVVTVPYAGGKVTVLVHNAFEPDWSD